MLLAFNLLITCFSLWIIMYLYNRNLKPLLINSERFKLYKIRDELAVLAMRGTIPEESDEYLILMRLINISIKELDKFNIVSFIKSLNRIRNDKNIQSKLDKILHYNDKSYKTIAESLFDINFRIFNKHTRLLRYIIYPLMLRPLFVTFHLVLSSSRVFLFFVARYKAYEETEDWLSRRRLAIAH